VTFRPSIARAGYANVALPTQSSRGSRFHAATVRNSTGGTDHFSVTTVEKLVAGAQVVCIISLSGGGKVVDIATEPATFIAGSRLQ